MYLYIHIYLLFFPFFLFRCMLKAMDQLFIVLAIYAPCPVQKFESHSFGELTGAEVMLMVGVLRALTQEAGT